MFAKIIATARVPVNERTCKAWLAITEVAHDIIFIVHFSLKQMVGKSFTQLESECGLLEI